MTFDDNSSTRTSTSWRSEALLIALLISGSALVYFYRFQIADERRFILPLAGAGFFFAPISARPLKLLIWFPAVALTAWGGRFAALGNGDLWLWLAGSIIGAALVVRAGGRAAMYYLPAAGSEAGVTMRRTIRNNLQVSFLLFAVVFIWDGVTVTLNPFVRAVLLLLSAVWFLRYLLLQAACLHLPPKPLRMKGIVPAQRWPLLIVVLFLGATRLADRLLPGGDDGPLLVTSMLLFVLAGLILAMALIRLEWPRSLVRKTSFLFGMGLAVALAAVVVEIEAWGPNRFTAFTTLCIFVLLVVPFARTTTRLFDPYPRASELIGPPVLSVMVAPLTAMNGWQWELTSTGFFLAFAVVMLVYHLVVATREGFGARVYVAASLVGLAILFFSNGTAWAENGAGWKIFLIALGFVLYAVDLRDRAGRVAKPVQA
ncbi:MAG: hypothetical protein BMS9Abin37_2398 [Acidobacteriota bacterium]|nr:MAG: hypothetical protein BMS9Abin37_2398 [Acidobacteriota bacterium]